MMILKTCLLFSLFALTTGSYAALPPLYNSLAELKAILEDKQLEESLTSGQAIVALKRVDDGYVIETPKYTLKVNVTYLPQAMPGPGKFKLLFQKPVPLISADKL